MKVRYTQRIQSGKNSNTIIHVYEQLPAEFQIKRIFNVFNIDSQKRGNHANKKTNQYLICTQGCVEVTLRNKDGIFRTHITPNDIVFIPKLTWVEYNSIGIVNSCVTVICDQPYDANEYYTNYQEFCAENKIEQHER
jgi:hypothetical protein